MEKKEYRKKPVVIQAYQANKDGEIKTLEGVMQYHKGDYIITGVRGEQYACREDIFKETYEPLERIPEETKTNEIDRFVNDIEDASSINDNDKVELPVEPILEENVSDGKVEPLQNGEREELEELLDIINWTSYVNVDVFEDKKTLPEQETEAGELIESKAKAFIEKIKSQSKKESYQSGCEDMLRDTCAKITLFIESESGKSGRKEILKFVESLTNQKKEDD